MSLFAVIREAGSGWTRGGITAQPGKSDHAAFMSALADEGFVLFAGPLAGSEHARVRVLLIVDTDDEAEINRRLADDPWTVSEQLRIERIESWNVFVGAERLRSEPAATA